MENRKTLFMFLPWSTDLTGYFYTNIADMEACVSRRGLEHERILVVYVHELYGSHDV